MAEKINIFELKIDVDAAIESTSDLKKKADRLKSSLDSLKKSGDTNSQTFVELKGTYDDVNGQYLKSQREISKLINLQNKEIKTLDQGRNALSIINKRWAEQAQLYGVNSDQADKLAKKKLELTERLKELESATGDNTRNVGNYSSALDGLTGKSVVAQKAQSVLNDIQSIAAPVMRVVRSEANLLSSSYKKNAVAAQSLSKGQKAVALATNLTSVALRILKIALIATGIGAIIVLIGSLIAWLSKTQAGIDFVNKVLAGLGAAFDVIIDRLSKVGGALVKLFSGNISGAFNDIKEAASGLGDELQREIALAIKLEEVLQNVEKAEINLDIRRAAANTRLKELNKNIEDTTRSEQERINAAQEFANIEQALVSEEVSNQEKRVAAMLGFAEVTDEVRDKIKQIGQDGVSLDALGLSESTVEDAKEFRDEVSKLFDLQTRSFEVQTTNQNKLNTVKEQARRKEEQAEKDSKKRRDDAVNDAIKQSKVELQLFEARAGANARTLTKEVEDAEVARDQKLEILRQELAAGKKTREEARLEEFNINQEFLDLQVELVINNAQRELDAFMSANESKLEANQFFSDELLAQEEARLQAQLEKQQEFFQLQLEQGVLNQQQFNDAINGINAENDAKKEELRVQREEADSERKAVDLENKRLIDEENFLTEFEASQVRLEQERQQEVKNAENTGADLALINKKFDKRQQQLDDQEQQRKIDQTATTYGQISGLLKGFFGENKALASALALADTFIGAQKAYTSQLIPGDPTSPVRATIAAGVATVTGLANVAKINDVKFEKGGLIEIGGKRHSAGGTKFYGEDGTRFEAEDGELIGVMNRNAAAMLMKFNNQYPSGVASRTNYLNSGGVVQRVLSSRESSQAINITQAGIDYQLLGDSVARANMSLPAPVVSVEDINTGQGRFADVVNGANI